MHTQLIVSTIRTLIIYTVTEIEFFDQCRACQLCRTTTARLAKTVAAQHYPPLAYILKMETASSSETSPTVCRLTRHHSPEDSHIHSTTSNTLLSIFLFALPLTYQGQEKKRSGCGGGRNRFPARDNRITLDPRPSPPSDKPLAAPIIGQISAVITMYMFRLWQHVLEYQD